MFGTLLWSGMDRDNATAAFGSNASASSIRIVRWDWDEDVLERDEGQDWMMSEGQRAGERLGAGGGKGWMAWEQSAEIGGKGRYSALREHRVYGVY